MDVPKSPPAVKAAVNAGTDCIVHGEELDEECKSLLCEHEVGWLPTLATLQFRRNTQGLATRDHPGLSRHYQNVSDCHARGVRLALGCDTFSDDRTPFGKHGLREIAELSNAGLGPMGALKSATVEGAELLGKAPDLGTLKQGAAADLVPIKGHPDQDVTIFDDPANVVFVMREGTVVKDSLGLSGCFPQSFSPFSNDK